MIALLLESAAFNDDWARLWRIPTADAGEAFQTFAELLPDGWWASECPVYEWAEGQPIHVGYSLVGLGPQDWLDRMMLQHGGHQ